MKKILLFCLFFAILLTAGVFAQDDSSRSIAETPMTKFLAKHYKVDPIVVLSLQQRMPKYADDASTALYIAKLADKDPMKMLDPRLSGKSWKQIMEDNSLNPRRLFIELPASAANSKRFSYIYSQMGRSKRNPNYDVVLYDNNIRDLVQLRLLRDAFKISPAQAIKGLDSRTFEEIINSRI